MDLAPVRRWVGPVVLLAVAGCSFYLATVAAAAPSPPGGVVGGRLQTPVLSPRRIPVAVVRLHAELSLAGGVTAALGDPALAGARSAVCLTVHDGERTLFEQGGDRSLLPASNMKLLTAWVALDRLGPDARFMTEVRADARPAGGVVAGNLYLVGGGDPLIQTADYNANLKDDQLPADGYTHFEDLAAAVVAAGVTEVRGAVVGDEGRYDTQRYVPTWKPGYISDSEVGPLSALEVNDGFVQFLPPKAVAAPAPAVLASGSLTALLTRAGVKVAGEPGQGATPAGTVPLASVQSPPVSTMVGEMLRASDNTTAELLTKELGHRFGTTGSTLAGVAVIRQTLAGAGLAVDQLAAVDGSGLDRSDRVTCPLLLAVLGKAGPTGPLADGLPVAAQTGTLRKRFLGTPVAGRLAAKTGSLEHVSALTGFMRGPNASLAFSLVANQLPNDATGRALQDRVAAVLAAYPAGPPAADIAPLPPLSTATTEAAP